MAEQGLRRLMFSPNRQQSAWMHAAFFRIPEGLREPVHELHAERRKAGFFHAQAWLEGQAETWGKIRVSLNLSDGEICDLAERRARECMGLPGVAAGSMGDMRARMAAYVERHGLVPPTPYRERQEIDADGVVTFKASGITDIGAVRRMSDPSWWRRALRVQQARELERAYIGLGVVHRRAQIYASDVTVQRRGQQKRRNAAAMDAVELENLDTGDVLRLSEIAAKSNANPAIRRGELMVRIAGFEAVAKGLEHAAEFVTLTAPSRFHPKKTGDRGRVVDNPKFTGESPRETQSYLVRIWAQIRAALHRAGIRPYGFRIAEPHHDGTPHWHMLLFVAADCVKRLREIIRAYALRMDGNEPGAQKNRVEFVAIDWKRGSAAGYVAKYVSKNIDGFQVQGDLEGENLDAVTGSQRVEAWASAWGIRQFQQVGGAPVGVWRELRRMREPSEDYSETLEAARIAADTANWRRYVEIQGGPTVERDALRLRVAYTKPGERWRESVGCMEPAALTRYGEIAAPAAFGVRDVLRGVSHASRFSKWQIKRGNRNGTGQIGRKAAAQLHHCGGAFVCVASGNAGGGHESPGACAGDPGATGRGGKPGRGGQVEVTDAKGFGSAAQPLAPWSPVNNCTRGDGNGCGGYRGKSAFDAPAVESGGKRAGFSESDVSGTGEGGIAAGNPVG
jgi:hypothetical protein